MKHYRLYLIGLILLTLTPLAFANPMLIAKMVEQFVETVVALENLQIKGDLDDIKKLQLMALTDEMKGVITTFSESSNFIETSSRREVYKSSLNSLNGSLEKSYSLAKMFLEDRKVTVATSFISTYGQLATLKKQVLIELGEVSVADNFQQDFDRKLSSLEAAKKVACGIDVVTPVDVVTGVGVGAGAAVAGVAAGSACTAGAVAGGVAGVGVFSWVTGPVGCIVGVVTAGLVATAVGTAVGTAVIPKPKDEECKKLQ